MPDKEEKKSALQADISLESIKALFSSLASKKTKREDGQVVPDNASDDFKPELPEVNLLPPQVKEGYEAKDLGKKFALGGLATVGVFGLLFGASIISGNIYQGKIQDIKAETTNYQTEISGLNAYSGYRSQVEAKRTNIASAMEGQVDVGKVSTDFKKSADKSGFEVSSLALSVSGGDEAVSGACVNPDPFTSATGIGCLTFSLKGDGSLSKLYELTKDDKTGFINIYVPSALNSEDGASIDGSVSITDKFVLTDYVDLKTPLNEVLSSTKTDEDK